MGLTQFIIDHAISPRVDRDSPAFRGKVGLLEGWVSIFGNFILFVIKFIFGIASSSIALIADAFHTLSDVATSGVVIFGFKVAQKPPDQEHPFGHGRAETIATLTIAILMAVVAFEFGKTAVDRLFFSQRVVDVSTLNGWFLLVVALTAVGKGLMAAFAYRLGEMIDSDTLRGDAVHHTSDVYTTLVVIAALIGARLGFPILDGIMGIVVALMILYSAYDIARKAIDELLGKPASSELLERIATTAGSVDGARQVHDVIVHQYGSERFISLHVEVDEETSPPEAHTIADTVERRLADDLNAQVVTHIDPVTSEGERVKEVRNLVEGAIQELDRDFEIQDLRVVGSDDLESVLFEIPIPPDCRMQVELEEAIRATLAKHYPKSAVIIEFKTQTSGDLQA